MKLVEAVEAHLNEQRTTLWGRAWDLREPTSKVQATAWLAEQVRGVLEAAR